MENSAVPSRRRRRKEKAVSGEDRFFSVLDKIQGALILSLIAGAPWFFGCTQEWSINLMNAGAFALGILTLAQMVSQSARGEGRFDSSSNSERGVLLAFFTVNLVLLTFCLVALFNARASFSVDEQTFSYREGVIPWLPTTYDSKSTLRFTINAFAFFAVFWSTRLWIQKDESGRANSPLNPGHRLKFVVWGFVSNGFLVALQGLLQRLSGSAKLIWFRTPYSLDPAASFGPFAYRGNAVDYLNLVWPVTFGFWYLLTQSSKHRSRGIGDGPELLLFPMFLITVGASFATLSRGGTVVASALVLGLVAILLFSRAAKFWKLTLGISLLVVLLAASVLFGKTLVHRFKAAASDNLSGRTEIYQNAQQIASDFKWFGSGPGTFMAVYYLYRQDPNQSWAAFLHDDWLETRVTLGRIGFCLVLGHLALLLHWLLVNRHRWISNVWIFSLLLSLSGCLMHAKVDFPFQTYGIVFTFVIVCALLSSSYTPRQSAHGDW